MSDVDWGTRLRDSLANGVDRWIDTEIGGAEVNQPPPDNQFSREPGEPVRRDGVVNNGLIGVPSSGVWAVGGLIAAAIVIALVVRK